MFFPYGKEKSRAPFPLTVADLGITYLLCYETNCHRRRGNNNCGRLSMFISSAPNKLCNHRCTGSN